MRNSSLSVADSTHATCMHLATSQFESHFEEEHKKGDFGETSPT